MWIVPVDDSGEKNMGKGMPAVDNRYDQREPQGVFPSLSCQATKAPVNNCMLAPEELDGSFVGLTGQERERKPTT